LDVSLIELIDKEVGEPVQLRPVGFGATVKEYMTVKNCSETLARNLLEKGVKEGVLDRKQMIVGRGAPLFVYFKKE
jgi:hypothetical protein